jgi:aspartyl-tRNA(Asn)/glutamyl-tRNA(Gln) amidotransferase subunit A
LYANDTVRDCRKRGIRTASKSFADFPQRKRNAVIDDEIASLSATELTAAYRRRTISPVEVARRLLDRIDRFEPEAKAFAWVHADTTMALARQSEQRWLGNCPLGPGDGIPTTVKDLMDVEGWPTLRGSRTSDPGVVAEADSPCVARLREAGVVFLGKTTVPEYGWKALNDSPLHGTTANPWDGERTAGGSSGGAAVAAVHGLGPWHTASDAAGSIRVPAAFCGVFGFKPTFGIVPLFPPSAFSGLGHHGPITRNVRDAAAMLTIMARPDSRDASAMPLTGIDFAKRLDQGIEGMRIGYVRSFPNFEIDPEIVTKLDAAVETLGKLGAIVEETVLDLSGARELIEVLWAVGCATLVEGIPEKKRDLLDP